MNFFQGSRKWTLVCNRFAYKCSQDGLSYAKCFKQLYKNYNGKKKAKFLQMA